jgi:hypothetical protein
MTAKSSKWLPVFALLAGACGDSQATTEEARGGGQPEGTVEVHEAALLDGSILVTAGWSAALDAVRLIRNKGSLADLKTQLTQIQQTQQLILAQISALEQQVRVNAVGDVVTRVSDAFQNAQSAESALGYYLNGSGSSYLTIAQSDSFNATRAIAVSDVPNEALGTYGFYWFLFNGTFVFSPLFASNDWIFALAARLDTLYAADPNTAANAKSELCDYVPRISRLADLTQQWVDAQYVQCYPDVVSDCDTGVKPPRCFYYGTVYCPTSGGWPFVTYPVPVFDTAGRSYSTVETATQNAHTAYRQKLYDTWGVSELRSTASELYSLATCNVWYE